MASNPKTGEGEYPEADWDPQFRGLNQAPKRALFAFDDLDYKMPPPGEDIVEGCKKLHDHKTNKLRETREAEIIEQAQLQMMSPIQPVLEACGINYAASTEARNVVRVIMNNIEYATFEWKVKYGRARPRMKCGKNLEPMLEPDSGLHPGHGSYPSGHASQAYCWAHLLGALDPTKMNDAMKAAKEVAFNREVAGVHFPSDTVVGIELGLSIARCILSKNKLTPYEISLLLKP